METIATQCYNILKDIPAKNWCIDEFYIPNQQKCCARGHIIRVACNNGEYNKEIENIAFSETCSLDEALIEASNDFDNDIANVNNGGQWTIGSKYQQKSPKARVIALLKDMIEAGY